MNINSVAGANTYLNIQGATSAPGAAGQTGSNTTGSIQGPGGSPSNQTQQAFQVTLSQEAQAVLAADTSQAQQAPAPQPMPADTGTQTPTSSGPPNLINVVA